MYQTKVTYWNDREGQLIHVAYLNVCDHVMVEIAVQGLVEEVAAEGARAQKWNEPEQFEEIVFDADYVMNPVDGWGSQCRICGFYYLFFEWFGLLLFYLVPNFEMIIIIGMFYVIMISSISFFIHL